MRLFILSKRKGATWEVTGPTDDYAGLREDFIKLTLAGDAANKAGKPAPCDQLLLWSSSGGVVKRKKFDDAAQLKARGHTNQNPEPEKTKKKG